MIIDLSVSLSDKTVTYPTDPVVSVKQIADLESSGYHVTALSMGSHSGTHVDLPYHCFEGGTDAASVSLAHFCGEAVILDVSCTEGKPVSLKDIESAIIKKGDILIIRTGWEEKAGTESFFLNMPNFDYDTADILKHLGVKTLGTDLPSVDCTDTKNEIHKRILGSGIMIIEALVNLKQLSGKRCFFSAVPLKIEHGDGSPVRAYAIIDQ
jgi:kynurenine formamidase